MMKFNHTLQTRLSDREKELITEVVNTDCFIESESHFVRVCIIKELRARFPFKNLSVELKEV